MCAANHHPWDEPTGLPCLGAAQLAAEAEWGCDYSEGHDGPHHNEARKTAWTAKP